MNYYNIVWVVVDSVRRYHSIGDDRGRLSVMDEFAENAIEFRNAVTSAPSTVMSISAMMTSLPAYYLGRNYSDFRFDNDYFTTLSALLDKNGWTTRALLMHKDIREKLRVFDLIPKRYWPKGFTHRRWWNNSEINALLRNAIRMDGSKQPSPCFWFLDFNCRKDPATSDIVGDSIQALMDAGYTRDNTVYVLCSDHGYPDPSRGITPEQLKRKGMSHDVFMTDDNILIPLIISYPGCKAGLKVDSTVSSLDVTPTIAEIIGIDVPEAVSGRWCGRSLLPYVEGLASGLDDKRMIRTDARFLGQSGRVTALRGERHKYVYYHDEKRERFFDISEGSLDERDVTTSNDAAVKLAFRNFRDAFEKSERDGVTFQIDYAVHKLEKQLQSLRKSARKGSFNVLIISNARGAFLTLIGNAFASSSHCGDISFVVSPDACGRLAGIGGFKNIYTFSNDKSVDVDGLTRKALQSSSYDLVIVTYDSGYEADFKGLLDFARMITSRRQVMMDINMSISMRKGELQRYLRTIYANRIFYIQEPALIFHELYKILRTSFIRLKSKVTDYLTGSRRIRIENENI